MCFAEEDECVIDPGACECSIMPIKEEQKVMLQECVLRWKRNYQDLLEEEHEHTQELEEQQQPPQKKQRTDQLTSLDAITDGNFIDINDWSFEELYNIIMPQKQNENLHYEKQNENQVDIHFNEHSVEMSEPIPMEQLETNLLPINQGFPSKLNAIIDGSFQTVENDIRSWSFEELYSIMPQEHEHQHYEKQKENQVEINVNEQLQTNQVSFNHGFTSILNAIIDGTFDADESDIIIWNFEEPYNIIMPKEQHENLHYEKLNEHLFKTTEPVSLKKLHANEVSINQGCPSSNILPQEHQFSIYLRI